MLRCQIPTTVLLILTLPLQCFAGERCCQSGGESCCSRPSDPTQTSAASCCTKPVAESAACSHCAAAEKKVADQQRAVPKTSSAGRYRCQCGKSPNELPVAQQQQRRQLSLASIPTPRESPFVPGLSPVRTRLTLEVTDKSPGLRLHAIHSVWLN